MSEEKTYEVNANLEAACTDEKCGGCGEVHPPVDIGKILKRQTRWYRLTAAAYFASLIATTGCVFQLYGGWGAGAFVAGFGVYFFHLSMSAMVRVLMTLEQALHGGDEQQPKNYGQYL